MRPPPAPPLTLACLLLLGACSSGGGSGSSSTFFAGSRGTGSVPIPSDTRRGGREGLPATPTNQTPAEVAAARQRALDAAEAAWKQAEALEPRDPEGAADRYTELADDYPISPRAGEARFRAGRAYYRAGEHRQAAEALEAYLQVAPANPHLAETEELLYKAGTAYLARSGGLLGLFKSDEPGYRILEYTATAFPNGRYADDALLALGDAYAAEDDKEGWIEAVNAYRRLLLEHPESELVPAARLALGSVYLARDQGAAYHGGYVDVDPREKLPSDPQAQANAGPVKSAPELALAQYEILLAAPRAGAVAPSASQRAAAERGAAQARERLAAKDLRIAGWYGGSRAPAAQAYLQAAAQRTGAPSGAGLPPAPGAPPPAPAPTFVQPPTQPPPVVPPPVVPPTVAPPTFAPATSVPPPSVPPTTQPRPAPPPVVVPPAAPPTAAPGALPPPAVRRVPAGASGSLR